MSELSDQAARFRALGDPTRLRIFQFLSNCCCPVALDDDGQARPAEGTTVGEVCCHVTGDSKVSSTISFHLKELKNSGLVKVERRGRHMLCSVEPEVVRSLIRFLGENHEK